MSNKLFGKTKITLLGAGCASLSLAARANELDAFDFTIVDSGAYSSKDHVWGFWCMPWLLNTNSMSRKKWFKWKIVSHDKEVIHSTDLFPYSAINRNEWISNCNKKALNNKVHFKEKTLLNDISQILDSRPPKVPEGNMLQHFVGYEVESKNDIFDDTTAILMDFRCDQSLGMHFIYCLPFSKRQALIESTLFTSEIAPSNFYDNAIKKYLNKIIGADDYKILREEKGAIPLGVFEKRNPLYDGIGGNGGAIRPSSGYAFSFIQKQIDKIISSSQSGNKLKVYVPHSRFELLMDRIFLKVLRRRYELAPRIFTNMANSLSGDEFAKFLNGEANIKLWTKVIFAMPKIPFIAGFFETLKNKDPRW